MRSHHIIAIAIVLVAGFGMKLFFFSAPTTEAYARLVESVRMNVSQVHPNIKNLPEQKMHDMTFVFSHGD